MGERKGGLDVGDDGHQCEKDSDEYDEVVEGIIRGLESRREDVRSEEISYFLPNPDDELNVPGLEVPEKED
jgi:hypothetical protein